jgi:hypothetical protein
MATLALTWLAARTSAVTKRYKETPVFLPGFSGWDGKISRRSALDAEYRSCKDSGP